MLTRRGGGITRGGASVTWITKTEMQRIPRPSLTSFLPCKQRQCNRPAAPSTDTGAQLTKDATSANPHNYWQHEGYESDKVPRFLLKSSSGQNRFEFLVSPFCALSLKPLSVGDFNLPFPLKMNFAQGTYRHYCCQSEVNRRHPSRPRNVRQLAVTYLHRDSSCWIGHENLGIESVVLWLLWPPSPAHKPSILPNR